MTLTINTLKRMNTMALSKDAREWLDKTNDEFMVPVAEYLDKSDQRGIFPDENDPHNAGWHARLSAPGYLDCTDWIGPYATEDEALEALYELYGDDDC